MNARALAAVAVPALLAGALLWRARGGAGSADHYDPVEYVAHANRFIEQGWLRADCQQEHVRLVPQLEQVSAAELDWYEQSYLAADVARFNLDPRGLAFTFVIDDDCRLQGVSPAAHRIALPFAERWPWLGSILFAGREADALLRSAERTLALRAGERPPDAAHLATTRVGASTDLTGQGALLLHFRGGPGQPAASVHHVGEAVVVRNGIRDRGSESVRLMGHLLPAGRLARLDTGDWLHLSATRPGTPIEETFVFLAGRALQVASAVRRQNERYERHTEEAALGLVADEQQERDRPYLELVAGSIDGVLDSLPPARARALADAFDLHLGIDREAQQRLSGAFARACEDVQRRQNRRARPFGAGLTVLDGRTGDVLALATFPDADGLPDTLDDAQRRRLLANQNLLRHPIGSAGKPFLYAAIAQAFPLLAQLELAAHPDELERPEVLQCELSKGYLVHGSGAPVDFRGALEMSSNRYTVELATLALAASGASAGADPARLDTLVPRDASLDWPRPGRSSGVRVAGQSLDYAPDLGTFLLPSTRALQVPNGGAARSCETLHVFDQARFREPLEQLTGAETYHGRTPDLASGTPTRVDLERRYRTSAYDLSAWGPLLGRLFQATSDERERWSMRAALQAIAPERVDLAFNQIALFRGDYLSLLLGGGNSTWTNVQLAEALARLVTGRAVEARLARGTSERRRGVAPQPAPSPQPFAALALGDDARRPVLEGLARVVSGEHGTAKELRPALRAVQARFPNERVELYSKTGTPTLDVRVPSGLAQALEVLVGRSRLTFAQGHVQVRTRDGALVPASVAPAVFQAALERALRELGTSSGLRGSPRRLASAVADVIEDFQDSQTAGAGDDGGESGPLRLTRGQLALDREHRVFRERSIPGRRGAVYIFCLVRRPPGDSVLLSEAELKDPRTRVLAVAVHLDTGPTSATAVQVAARLLPDLAPLLE